MSVQKFWKLFCEETHKRVNFMKENARWDIQPGNEMAAYESVSEWCMHSLKCAWELPCTSLITKLFTHSYRFQFFACTCSIGYVIYILHREVHSRYTYGKGAILTEAQSAMVNMSAEVYTDRGYGLTYCTTHNILYGDCTIDELLHETCTLPETIPFPQKSIIALYQTTLQSPYYIITYSLLQFI